MKNNAGGITLLELIISIMLAVVILATLSSGYLFIHGRLLENIQEQDIHLQMDYALENIRLHTLSAISIDSGSTFPAGIDSSRNSFSFEGESDIYNITPDNTSDDVKYSYLLDDDKNLILETQAGSNSTQEVLVSGRYSPNITFSYQANSEPNFITVTINATGRQGNISKTEGLRFWFTDAARPN